MDFNELRQKLAKIEPPEVLLALDPGAMCGVAVFTKGVLTSWEQVPLYDFKTERIYWDNWLDLFNRTQPTYVICEDYLIYKHKLEQHTFNHVPTLRVIGGIELTCHKHNVPIAYQNAQQHKGWCTDDKLKKWGFWQTGMRHSRDAIRAGCYFLLFHKEGE